jgi:hypothetical protein
LLQKDYRMNKLFAFPLLLLAASPAALLACGGTTVPVAADGSPGAGAPSTAGASGGSSQSAGGTGSSTSQSAGGASSSTSQSAAGASSGGASGVHTTPIEPPNANEAGASSSASSDIKCGASTCNSTTEFCFGAVGGLTPDQFSCKPIPSECVATPTCGCIVPTQPTGSCPCTEIDGVRVSCELG